jgi:imidazolonepropionase-like amidohydrolase
MTRTTASHTFVCAVAVLLATGTETRTQDNLKPHIILLKAARLLDIRKGNYVEHAAVLIDGQRIKEAGAASAIEPHAGNDAQIIDLGNATLLPGLIDCHTHLMARIPAGSDGYVLNLATKSQAFRALEGAADARATLRAGFTAVRDVENEGSDYADVALRDAVNQGLVEGPRMQVATRAIAAVGQYDPFGVAPDLTAFPTGAQMVSGADEARRAVREQIGHGADLIKVYADWMYPTLTVEEITVIVQEAHKAGRKVAAHATTPEGIRNAVTAGVDSIEHGHGADRSGLEMMKARDVYWVPTMGYFFYSVDQEKSAQAHTYMENVLERARQNIPMARQLGIRIASGFDGSTSESHGQNARELMAMTRLGLTPIEAIRAATTTAAELMGWQDRIGAIEPGKYADIIAVTGDPLIDIARLQSVEFVMKGGEVVKSPRRPD